MKPENEEAEIMLPPDNYQGFRILSAEEELMVEFLIARQHGIPTSAMVSTLSQDDKAHYTTDTALEIYESYTLPCRYKSAAILEWDYRQEQRIFSEELSHHSKLNEADAADWLQRDGWYLEEALSLSMSFVPHAGVKNWASKNRFLQSTPAQICARLDLIERALAVGDLREPFRPAEFLAWARKKGLPTLVAPSPPPSSSDVAMRLQAEIDKNSALHLEIKALKKDLSESKGYKQLVQAFAVVCVSAYKVDLDSKHDTNIDKVARLIEDNTSIYKNAEPRSSNRFVKNALKRAKDLSKSNNSGSR